MQRIISKSRLLSRGLGSHSRRCFSQLLSQRADRDVNIPKMPPFDYTPPPYNGPSSAEILQKRREFLSPSMFYFYNNPSTRIYSNGSSLQVMALPSEEHKLFRSSSNVYKVAKLAHSQART